MLLLACSPEALAIPHAPPSVAVRTRATPPIVAVATLERAPFDARSVTQSFAMWEATAPPDGFTWGYDTRYAEMYEQEANKPVVGVPSVGVSVWSWFDSGVRLSAAEEPAAALVAKEATASAPAVSEGTITLTPEQVKAFGEPAVRALTDAVADAPAAEATITLTAEQVKAFGEPAVRTLTDAADGAPVADATPAAEATITLTAEQVKAFGEPAVRSLTDAVADAPAAEASITLTAEQVKAFGKPAVRTLTDAADGASVADEATITLTAEQVKAFGGSAVRTLTAV